MRLDVRLRERLGWHPIQTYDTGISNSSLQGFGPSGL